MMTDIFSPKPIPRRRPLPEDTPLQAPSMPVATTPVSAKPIAPERAKMRAKPNWEDMDDTPEGPDRFHIPKEKIPDGMDLTWVTVDCYGQPQTSYRASFEKRGWTPVHADDFDGQFDGMFMPKGQQGEINLGGQVLMARPLELSVKSRQRDAKEARLPAQLKQQALMSGDIPGVTGADHPLARAGNVVNRSIERVEIPKD